MKKNWINRVPLSEIQKGIYFDCQVENTFQYHISGALKIKNIDPALFEKALDRVIAKHCALRSCIELENDLPVLAVYPEVPFRLNHVDLSGDREHQEEVIKELMKKNTLDHLPLHEVPLLRASLLKVEADTFIFLICVHHIISDGMSLEIFKKDLLAFYKNLREGNEVIPEEDISFIDFLNSENEKLRHNQYAARKKYWLEKISGAEALNLPTDYPLQHKKSGLGKELQFQIAPEVYREISELCKEEEVTLFTFFLAAFQSLLHKYTGSEDITIATPLTHRPGVKYEEVVGCFINMLPLRIAVEQGVTFKTLLQRTFNTLIELYKNVGYPNNLIVRDSKLGTDLMEQSIFDISFVCDIYMEDDAPADMKMEELPQEVASFPGTIMFTVVMKEDTVGFKIMYDSSLFNHSSMELMGKRFNLFLCDTLKDINRSVDKINFIEEQEKKLILEQYNFSDYFSHTPGLITNLLEAKAALYPGRDALVYGDTVLSYRDVNKRANQLAAKILSLITGHNPAVGLTVRRSLDMVIGILGILKAGCAYVPIGPDYPRLRKEFIVEDAAISLIVTTKADYEPIDWKGEFLFLDDPAVFTGDGENVPVDAYPHDLAYIIYTSGSTGNPKGVMIEHQSVVNVLKDLERKFPLGAGDTYLLKTPYTFDVFGTEVFGWFFGEGRGVLLERGSEKIPEKILDTIEKYKITHVNFVPSMFRLFLELFDTQAQINKLSGLKYIFIGGEAVTPDIIKKFYSLDTGVRFENVYGPTECTIWASHYALNQFKDGVNVPIGNPLNGIRWYIVNKEDKIQPVGIPGELCLSGIGLARGYLNRPDLNEEKFVPNPFYIEGYDPQYFRRMYRTGDSARWLPDGSIEFLGRIDFQVKIRGSRLELGEIENVLAAYPGVIQAVVVVKNLPQSAPFLCAYYMSEESFSSTELREFLSQKLPAYMIPSYFVHKEEMPLSSAGKVDRKNLIKADDYKIQSASAYVAPETDTEKIITEVWKEVLGVDRISLDDNFFDSGGHSLALIQVVNKLKKQLQGDISILTIFQYPSVRLLSRHLSYGTEKQVIDRKEFFSAKPDKDLSDIAVIGLAVRVPGAADKEQFWNNLVEGRECIRFFTDEELRAAGYEEELIGNPDFIKAKGALDDLQYFDSHFFDYSPREARMMDPQLRALYQLSWEALEDSGYPPDKFPGKIGYYAGGSDNMQWMKKYMFAEDQFNDVYNSWTMSSNHFISTRIAYKLNLTGPVFTTLTGCSTTLVTAHLACQALKLKECDIAVAGGITIELPNDGGYLYEEGMMFSPDGHCRPFDAEARGTVFSNGLGLVVLKRLKEAVRDKDHIYAVIKGSAVNNDGKQKIGYTAPSIEGQARVITCAYRNAGIDPETVSYVEAHGTGTALGDPIEVESLKKAFRSTKKQFCRIGSVKGNVGHTDTAAGIVGLIKVALSLKNKIIPPTINHTNPNPKIDFEHSPFLVNTENYAWQETPRRAGINSFGVGGTNAHMIMEEPPAAEVSSPPLETNLLLFSAKSGTALENTALKTRDYLVHTPGVNITDAAYTLQFGRQAFAYRKAVVVNGCGSWEKDFTAEQITAAPVYNLTVENRNVYFLFSGQGNQYYGMVKDLYAKEPLFRAEFDDCLQALPVSDKDRILDKLYGNAEPTEINETEITQVVLFTVEYALARYLMQLGIVPKGMLGHSIGELAAAAVAGVFSPADAVNLVLKRGRLMQSQPRGVMLVVLAAEEAVRDCLEEGIYLALVNTTGNCVVSGKEEDVCRFEAKFAASGIKCIRIKTSHPFHSPLMHKAAGLFREEVKKYALARPEIPFLSNASGDWITGEEAQNPEYWGSHITSTVAFEKCLEKILADENAILVEIGAGKSLVTFCQQHKDRKPTQCFVNMVRHPKETADDQVYLYGKLGRLWCEGVSINWHPLYAGQTRYRIPLPTYAFDKLVYPVEVPRQKQGEAGAGTYAMFDDTVILQERAEEIADFSEPQDQWEAKVLDAYKRVLGFDRISMHENFFEIGGDSLKAISLSAAINKQFNIKVELSRFFKHPTPQSLAAYLATVTERKKEFRPVTPVREQEFYPLSSAQQRMYSLYLLDKENLAYNLPSAIILNGNMEKSRLENAVKKLIRLHECLRTSFEIRNDKPVQIIHPGVELPVKYKKYFVKEEREIEKIIHDFIMPFDLTLAPLFRTEFVDIGKDRTLFLFDIHHIVADGTSMELLTKDFSALCFGEVEPPQLQYKDFAVWQNEYLQSGELKSQKEYWLKQFEGEIPVLDLPADYDRPAVKTFDGDTVHFCIDSEMTSALKELARKQEATLFITMLAFYCLLLYKYSGQEDIVVGTPTAGRTRHELQGMTGMFVNTLALRSFPKAELTFPGFFAHIKETALKAFENQDYQFDDLVEQLNLKRELSRNPLFDVSFDFQNMEFHDLEIGNIKADPFSFETRTSTFDLVLGCKEDKETNTIACSLEYYTKIFKKSTVERMAAHYRQLINSVLGNPEVTLGEIDYLSTDEKRQLLVDFNRTELACDESYTIQEMFEEMVNAFPDKIALVSRRGGITYKELNEKTNRLAHYLRSRGVKANTLVGLIVQRSHTMFAAMLAVLKAGGAYVPIDPEFPRQRLNSMIEQSQMPLIITQQSLLGRFDFPGTIIDIDNEELWGENTGNPENLTDPGDLCWVIYTSGSTGTPKGVMVAHKAMINFIYDIIHRGIFEPGDRVIAVTTVSFDIFGFESITPLCTGHSVYLADEEEQLDPALVNQAILKHNVTHILSTVSRIKAFVENPEFAAALGQLKCVLSGGENYPGQLLKNLQQKSAARLYNMYGPAETTIWSTTKDLTASDEVTIGSPIANTQVYILNSRNLLQPVGVFGELCIGGKGLAEGYWKNSGMTAERFVAFEQNGNRRIYKTGDRARWLASGEIELKGRFDSQIKIRGYRIELGEIERAALTLHKVKEAVVLAFDDAANNKFLALYFCEKEDLSSPLTSQELKEYLNRKLPQYMIPSHFIKREAMPYLPNGKLNRNAFVNPRTTNSERGEVYFAPSGDLEKSIAAIWKEVLGLEKVSIKDNFFDIGGNSLSLILVNNKLNTILPAPLPVLKQFQYTTIESLVHYCEEEKFFTKEKGKLKKPKVNGDIAVIGCAGKFPGAVNIEEFWVNIKQGAEAITFFTDEELAGCGIDQEMLKSPRYVKAKGYLEGAEFFDSEFFGYSPREAGKMDPQIRLLHQCTWEALENAGYDPADYKGAIGLFAGSASNILWMARFLGSQGNLAQIYEAETLNEKDFLTTRISYKLGLKGPSYNIQTACSTSLVAIHQACQSILKGESDLALAGGVSVSFPRKEGYLHQEGMIFSRDGHCRPFDADSSGTISGNGVGMVVLKRLEEALEDRDTIYAVIKGSAINNDGLRKIGYTAPSIEGQSEVIKEALAIADVQPETISFVEAHGTGTKLGDPVEVEALTQAYNTAKRNYCALSSVKANIGHLDTAAGVAGFIKVVLSLYHKTIPPAVNFTKPNPGIQLQDSPFYIPVKAIDCGKNRSLLRAGISAFGIGGTNAHLILEEAPGVEESSPAAETNLLLFSGKSLSALENTSRKIRDFLVSNPHINITDAAYTLQTGRKSFGYRKALVAGSREFPEEDFSLEKLEETPVNHVTDVNRNVYFLFSGQGSQYYGMGKALYEKEPLFREEFDLCLHSLPENDRQEILNALYGDAEQTAINRTAITQVALFALEYSLARYLLKLGIKPRGMAGHSIGEITAAALAGVFSPGEAAAIVLQRGRLMQNQPEGVMLSVTADEAAIRQLLPENVYLALVNTTGSCVVSGKEEDIVRFEALLKNRELKFTRIKTAHPFHSPLMKEAAERFTEVLEKYGLNKPSLPFLSNVSGGWINPETAMSPAYWGSHITSVVEFEKCLEKVLEDENAILIEIGAGKTLLTFARQHKDRKSTHSFINLVRHPKESADDRTYLYEKLGKVWCEGVNLNWKPLYAGQVRYRINLPAYVFDKQVYDSDINLLYVFKGGNSVTSPETPQAQPHHPEAESGSAGNKWEEELLRIWKEVLGLDRIGIDDNFFDLGGHSLMAISMSAIVNKQLNKNLPLEEIFRLQTIRQMAKHLAKEGAEKNFQAIAKVKSAPFYEVSSAQKRMFALYQMFGKSTTYNMPAVYFIRGKPDRNKLEETLKQLTLHHESLRTEFLVHQGSIVQRIKEQAAGILEYSESPEGSIEEELEKFVRPFELERAPLIRVKVVKIKAEEFLFMLDMHHIITDQTSVNILAGAFTRLYQGQSLKSPGIQYKDYAAWQNEQLRNGSMQKEEAYWKQEFAGEIPVLNLPTDYSRPVVQSLEGDCVEFTVDRELSTRIKTAAHAIGGTPCMIFMSALYIVLWKYSRQIDIVLGMGISGRVHAELEEIIGMFVNTLAIRNKIDEETTVKDFLLSTKAKLLQGYENQNCQFEKLVEELDIPKDLSRNPLFDIIINYLNMGVQELELEGLTLKPCNLKNRVAKFDQTWTIMEDKEQFTGEVEYCTKLFKRETIERLITHVLKTVSEITGVPERRLKEIRIIPEQEQKLILEVFNRTKTVYPQDKTITALFEAQAALRPENIALEFEDTKLTYRELNQKANQLARILRNKGVKAEQPVGIMARRSIETIIGTIAILKAGGGYVPVDPDYPQDRIDYMIEDSGIKVMLLQKEYRGKAGTVSAGIFLETDYAGDTTNLPLENQASDLAYIMYTSGSTGKPKGAVINHRNVIRLVRNTNYIELTEKDSILQTGAIVFDAATFEIWGALLNGGRLCLVKKEDMLDPEAFGAALRKHRITTMFLTTALFNQLSRDNAEIFGTLKTLLVGGEIASTEHFNAVRKACPSLALFNVYGPTENTTFSTFFKIEKDYDRNIPIGGSISNSTAYIVDPYYNLLPVGVPGELCLGGDGVGRGYLNKPELTAEKFVENPFAPGTRMYRSGDLARWLPGGAIDFLGRLDFQVKIRGFRIEVGEIEKEIFKVAGIDEAIVLVKSDENGNKYLAAYYAGPEKIACSALKDYLSKKLPAYMLPSHLMWLEKMPLNINGKIDRNALPEIEGEGSEEGTYVPPRNTAEEKMAQIMANVLDVKKVGIHDNFFDLGGHSIKAISLVQLLNKEGFNLRVNDIFRLGTIAGMSAHLGVIGGYAGAGEGHTPEEPGTADSPCLPEQWMESGNTPGNDAGKECGRITDYQSAVREVLRMLAALNRDIKAGTKINEFAFSPVQKIHNRLPSSFSGMVHIINHPVTMEIMQETFTEILNCHQILRCTGKEEETVWCEYAPGAELELPYLDLSHLSTAHQEPVLKALYRVIINSPYVPAEIQHRPLLIRQDYSQYLLLWGFNHTAFDGMSSEILKSQVETIYRNKITVKYAPPFEAQSYESYTAQILAGPRDTGDEEIVNALNLKEYAANLDTVINMLCDGTKAPVEYHLRIPVTDIPEAEIAAKAFAAAREIVTRYTGLDAVPVGVINYGRSYGGKAYYDCIGEFLDIIPVLINGNADAVPGQIAFCRAKNINFLALATEQKLKAKYKRTAALSRLELNPDKRFEAILFNFQGKSLLAENRIVHSLSSGNTEPVDPLGIMVFTVNYDEAGINIDFTSVYALEESRIERIIDDLTNCYPDKVAV